MQTIAERFIAGEDIKNLLPRYVVSRSKDIKHTVYCAIAVLNEPCDDIIPQRNNCIELC